MTRADLLNDAWGGYDPAVRRRGGTGVGLVCTHTGGAAPRTRPHRVEYEDAVGAVVGFFEREAARTEAAGVIRDRILIDPGHDFGKNTRHSLEVTRRLAVRRNRAAVLVSLSNKDFVGETLDRPVDDRLYGTLAAYRGQRLAGSPGLSGACGAGSCRPREVLAMVVAATARRG